MKTWHPASVLLAWASLMILAQLARGPWCGGLGLVLLGCMLAWAPARGRRLLRRVRVLLVVLFVLFVFFTPGEALLPWLGSLGPTREGLELAALHGMRLVMAVSLVALLLEHCSETRLVRGLVALARPLAPLGLSPERLGVRMLLVLRYVETPPPGGWRQLLTEHDHFPDLQLVLDKAPWGLHDFVLMALALLGLSLGLMV